LIFKLIKIFIFLSLLSCAREETSRAEFALGTVCTVTLFENGQRTIYNNIFSGLREIEKLMSVNIPVSDVSRVNAAAGKEKVPVSKDVFAVIERAVFFAEISGGAFDPTVGPLISLWGIGGDNPRVPSHEEIEKTLVLVNWRNIELDTETRSIFLKYPGMALDLGGIAKGYAAGVAAAIVKNSNLERAIIDLGGDIVVFGEKQDKSPWRIGIQNPNPDERRGVYIGVLQIPGKENTQQTIVTSGVYERFFEKNGRHYHHIFSPWSGYPSENGLLSVTVIAEASMDADALSTSVFVLGYERGRRLIENKPGVEAVFVFEDNSVRITPGVDFRLTDRTFRIES